MNPARLLDQELVSLDYPVMVLFCQTPEVSCPIRLISWVVLWVLQSWVLVIQPVAVAVRWPLKCRMCLVDPPPRPPPRSHSQNQQREQERGNTRQVVVVMELAPRHCEHHHVQVVVIRQMQAKALKHYSPGCSRPLVVRTRHQHDHW